MVRKALFRGFLLVELMVTVALLCLTVILLQGAFSASSRGFVRSSLDQLYATCLMAQKRAMMTGLKQEIVFEIDRGSYRSGAERTTLPKGVEFGCLAAVQGPPATPQALVTKASTFAHHTITCTPEGSLSSGTVYLIDSKKTVLYALSSGVVSVSFLRKYRYAKGWHYL
jgi:type II secretory pathway pseudopilin PulG